MHAILSKLQLIFTIESHHCQIFALSIKFFEVFVSRLDVVWFTIKILLESEKSIDLVLLDLHYSTTGSEVMEVEAMLHAHELEPIDIVLK